MTTLKLFASFVLAAAIVSTLSAETRCPGNVASLPVRQVQSTAIVIPVEVNQSGPYDFMVDTGAQVTSIDSSLAAELHLKPQSVVGVTGAATYARGGLVNLDRLQAGTQVVEGSPAVTIDIALSGIQDRRVRGILGGSFLEHFDVLIDNRRHLMCLDDTDAMASAIRGERIPLAEPYGPQTDLPFTRPIEVSARLSATAPTPILLRLDSGSNVPALYSTYKWRRPASLQQIQQFKRMAYGIEQDFALLAPQELRIGRSGSMDVSFVIPLNQVGNGGPTPREDGVLPTLAYQRVFISCKGGYAVLQAWD